MASLGSSLRAKCGSGLQKGGGKVQLGREFLYPGFDQGQPERIAFNDYLGLLPPEMAAGSGAAYASEFGVAHSRTGPD
jgi:hypothetical protein